VLARRIQAAWIDLVVLATVFVAFSVLFGEWLASEPIAKHDCDEMRARAGLSLDHRVADMGADRRRRQV
jgi:hypothetical protein